MNPNFIIIGLVAVMLSSCDDKKQTTASDTPAPLLPFNRAIILEVTPMSDGSAYASSIDSRLWYIRGDKAVRVTVAGDASQQMRGFSEITPAADGSAYATRLDSDGGLWHLHADHAEKVNEAASLADLGPLAKIPDKAFYALYLSEHKKRKEAEDQLDDLQNPPESEQ